MSRSSNSALQLTGDAMECSLRSLYVARPQLNLKRYHDPLTTMNGDHWWLRGTATATSTTGGPVHVCGSMCVATLCRGSGAGPCVSAVRVHVRAARIRGRGVSRVRRGCVGPCAPRQASTSARRSMCAGHVCRSVSRDHVCRSICVTLCGAICARPGVSSGAHPRHGVVARGHVRVAGVSIRVRVHLRRSMCAAAPPGCVGTPVSGRGEIAFGRGRMHHVPC